MAAMIGSSMALSVSDIPFQGPIAGVNVGYIDGKYVINPSVADKEISRLDLEVAGHKDAVNMVEAGASEITESEMLEAIFSDTRKSNDLLIPTRNHRSHSTDKTRICTGGKRRRFS